MFIIIPFFINIYSIYKLISIGIGIILLDISFIYNKKINIFLLIYIPILLIIFTYAVDYIKTYTLNISPIYVIENKINDNVSIYNSIFYRVYRCNNEYIFDNDYKKNYLCDTSYINNIDINTLLSDPLDSYKKYKNDFIKVTGKISKIVGSNNILMQSYTVLDSTMNGYVKFDESSKLKVNLDNVDINKYRIYDYITVVGLLSDYDKDMKELTLIDVVVEDNNLYDRYDLQVIESNVCNKEIKNYSESLYTYCIENIYLNYKVDKYELSYALKDKRITFEDLTRNIEKDYIKDKTIYKFDKFNILSCSDNKKIIINKDVLIDYSFCEEES